MISIFSILYFSSLESVFEVISFVLKFTLQAIAFSKTSGISKISFSI
jgi:hypothetical protein